VETVFGFFPLAAFAEQTGLPPSAEERSRLAEPCTRGADLRSGTALAGPMLLMLDRVTGWGPGGGRGRLGRLRAEKDGEPGVWFSRAHFFQDPVQPGSLGVQAMCQLLQWYLVERGATAGLPEPRFQPIMTGRAVTWRYRGQVVPADRLVTVELEVTAAGEDE